MVAELYAPEQLRQAKRGFTLPLAAWLSGPLREMMEDSLTYLSTSGLLAPDGIEHVRRTYLHEPHTAAWSRLWALVALAHWLKETSVRPTVGVAA